jgi:hypothetical protein
LPVTRARALAIAQQDPSWADAALALALHGSLHDAARLRAMFRGPSRAHAVLAAATLGSAVLVPDLLDLLSDGMLAGPETLLVQQAVTTITGLPAGPAHARAWAERAEALAPGCRYRHGRVLEPARLLELLQSPEPGPRPPRQQLYVELCGWTQGRVPRFNAYDFVGVQRLSLQRIARWVAQESASRRAAEAVLH